MKKHRDKNIEDVCECEECTCENNECDNIENEDEDVEYKEISLEELQAMMSEQSGMQHTCTYGYEDLFDLEDLEERRLYLNCAISKDFDEPEIYGNKVENIIYHIMRYNREDKYNEIPLEERKPIILYINSPGGEVPMGMSLIDTIIMSKTPVYTVNIGICYSMGYLIYIAGHKRYAYPSSSFLLHDGRNFAYDSSAKFADKVKFDMEQTEKRIRNYVIGRTRITEEVYDSKYRVEWYSYPEEAKKFGICNYIVGIDCDFDEIL